jgi:hypothetical protein
MDKQERLSLVWSRIVPLLQDLVRELEITQDELHVAADYLTRTAKAGVMRSLLDSTLSMAAVEAVEGRIAGTRPNPEGPYFRLDAPLRPDGSLLEQPPGENAEVLTVRGRVLDGRSGRPRTSGVVVDTFGRLLLYPPVGRHSDEVQDVRPHPAQEFLGLAGPALLEQVQPRRLHPLHHGR